MMIQGLSSSGSGIESFNIETCHVSLRDMCECGLNGFRTLGSR